MKQIITLAITFFLVACSGDEPATDVQPKMIYDKDYIILDDGSIVKPENSTEIIVPEE